MVLGHEGAGIIEEVGPGVSRVKAGDHVGKVGRLDREKKSKVAVTLFPEGQLEVAADAVAVKRKLRMSDAAVAEAQYEKWAREHGVGEKYKEAYAGTRLGRGASHPRTAP